MLVYKADLGLDVCLQPLVSLERCALITLGAGTNVQTRHSLTLSAGTNVQTRCSLESAAAESSNSKLPDPHTSYFVLSFVSVGVSFPRWGSVSPQVAALLQCDAAESLIPGNLFTLGKRHKLSCIECRWTLA